MKKINKYTWNEIKDAIENIYALDSHKDSWNVSVVYQDQLLRVLKRQLKTSYKQEITP